VDFTVKRLDHLGIIAGIMQDLNIAKLIDERFKPDRQMNVTPGEAVVAMILNGLGFSNRVTTLTPQFFSNKPMNLLMGKDITEEQLNRHKLGRTLDAIASYGCEKLFNEIALLVCTKEEIDLRKAHNDTTSFSVEGSYENQLEDAEVHITHGYSKAKRPDLKQIILELVVSFDGGTPFMMKPWSGNTADTKIFNERIKELQKAGIEANTGRTLIADSKLYTEENIKALEATYFITRVPATIKEEKIHVLKALNDNIWTEIDKSYKFRSFDLHHYGIEQRWIVFYSEAARNRAEKTLEKTVQKHEKELETDLSQLEKKHFGCHDDANKALESIIKKYRYHQINDSKIIAIKRYEKPGKPAAGVEKIVDHYEITATFSRVPENVKNELNQRSCFVLATNISKKVLVDSDVLKEYKHQDCVEKCFEFMKAPSFFAASFFIKSTTRIQAMLVVMTLALLIYTVAQRRLRKYLSINKETIPNQIKKPTERPTLRWAFQLLEGIDYVINYAVPGLVEKMILGLTDLRKQILSCFGETVLKIYQINRPDGYFS